MKWFHHKYGKVGVVVGAILAGIITFFLLSPVPKNISTQWFAEPTPTATPTPIVLPPPSAINIPKIHKNLPIKPASVRGNDWDLFDDAVAWLSTSAVPGKGNVILYAHDWRSLWADLYLLKKGDLIEVQQGSAWISYTVTESRAIDLHDVKAILSDKERLTLYTCEGSFDQKRRLVYAERTPTP